MQKYDVVETELFEQTTEDAVDYLWTKFRNDQAIEHLVTGILEAKEKLEYVAGVLPYYNADKYEQYIQVDNMEYIIIYVLDNDSPTAYLIRLAHYLQNR